MRVNRRGRRGSGVLSVQLALIWMGSAALAAATPLQAATLPLVSDRHTAHEQFQPDPADILFSATFPAQAPDWTPIYLDGDPTGGDTAPGEKLELRLAHPHGTYAWLQPTPVHGQFYAETTFDHDDGACLVLAHSVNGRPDPDNFTSIGVETDAAGKVSVFVRDRQHGKDDVLDCQAKGQPNWWRKRYRLTLDHQFSVPASRTSGRFRIFHDSAAGMFHFYFGIREKIDGELCSGFLELSPSPDWLDPQESWLVGCGVRTAGTAPASASFSSLQAVRVPTVDQDDRNTGFKVTRRDYHWSGFFGQALVVTFGPEAPFSKDDRKFVFWSEANYLPFWHMDNQYACAFGNNETWGGSIRGGACFEPMSDRLLRYSKAEVVEDNAVRKIIHWHYAEIDPDYVPYGWRQGGKQLSTSDEYWSFFPDGTVLRRQQYYPCLDSTQPPHPLGVKLYQADIVFGSSSLPGDYLDPRSLSVFDLIGDLEQYAWPGQRGDFDPSPGRAENLILAVHSARPGMPDAFTAFAQNIPALFPNPPMDLGSDWHRMQWWRFSHWPIDRQPYMWDSNSQIDGRGQPTHTCLVAVCANQDLTWEHIFKTDAAGRKYRQWTSMVGLSDRKDYPAMQERTASWIYGGQVTNLDGPSAFLGYDPVQMAFLFNAGTADKFQFRLTPYPRSPVLAHPFLQISNWGSTRPSLTIDGTPLEADRDFRWDTPNGVLLIWINRRIDKPVDLVIAPA